MTERELSTPVFLVYEDRLRRNLGLIRSIEQRAGVRFIMAFKANALWRTFDIMKEYNTDFTASSLNELMLGTETLGGEAHVYCPVYTPGTIDKFLEFATHVTFNSIEQLNLYGRKALETDVSPGLRVNPECSVIETDLYNPALPGSRFGVTSAMLAEAGGLPEWVEGLHFHALCEGSSHHLEKVLEAFEREFGSYLNNCGNIKWVNFGGGHLVTRADYDVEHLVSILHGFKERHPGIGVILEPGSAFTWRTGDLLVSVEDVVENQGVKTAIIDASFACHMPDCLEMPYQPAVTEACPPDTPGAAGPYRLGGNSCLSGDWCGDWYFRQPLRRGDRLRIEDMNHYTTVKTTMFNGIDHPDIALCNIQGDCRILRHFDYSDYKNRMS